jgi:hypothetical protein
VCRHGRRWREWGKGWKGKEGGKATGNGKQETGTTRVQEAGFRVQELRRPPKGEGYLSLRGAWGFLFPAYAWPAIPFLFPVSSSLFPVPLPFRPFYLSRADVGTMMWA